MFAKKPKVPEGFYDPVSKHYRTHIRSSFRELKETSFDLPHSDDDNADTDDFQERHARKAYEYANPSKFNSRCKLIARPATVVATRRRVIGISSIGSRPDSSSRGHTSCRELAGIAILCSEIVDHSCDSGTRSPSPRTSPRQPAAPRTQRQKVTASRQLNLPSKQQKTVSVSRFVCTVELFEEVSREHSTTSATARDRGSIPPLSNGGGSDHVTRGRDGSTFEYNASVCQPQGTSSIVSIQSTVTMGTSFPTVGFVPSPFHASQATGPSSSFSSTDGSSHHDTPHAPYAPSRTIEIALPSRPSSAAAVSMQYIGNGILLFFFPASGSTPFLLEFVDLHNLELMGENNDDSASNNRSNDDAVRRFRTRPVPVPHDIQVIESVTANLVPHQQHQQQQSKKKTTSGLVSMMVGSASDRAVVIRFDRVESLSTPSQMSSFASVASPQPKQQVGSQHHQQVPSSFGIPTNWFVAESTLNVTTVVDEELAWAAPAGALHIPTHFGGKDHAVCISPKPDPVYYTCLVVGQKDCKNGRMDASTLSDNIGNTRDIDVLKNNVLVMMDITPSVGHPNLCVIALGLSDGNVLILDICSGTILSNVKVFEGSITGFERTTDPGIIACTTTYGIALLSFLMYDGSMVCAAAVPKTTINSVSSLDSGVPEPRAVVPPLVGSLIVLSKMVSTDYSKYQLLNFHMTDELIASMGGQQNAAPPAILFAAQHNKRMTIDVFTPINWKHIDGTASEKKKSGGTTGHHSTPSTSLHQASSLGPGTLFSLGLPSLCRFSSVGGKDNAVGTQSSHNNVTTTDAPTHSITPDQSEKGTNSLPSTPTTATGQQQQQAVGRFASLKSKVKRLFRGSSTDSASTTSLSGGEFHSSNHPHNTPSSQSLNGYMYSLTYKGSQLPVSSIVVMGNFLSQSNVAMGSLMATSGSSIHHHQGLSSTAKSSSSSLGGSFFSKKTATDSSVPFYNVSCYSPDPENAEACAPITFIHSDRFTPDVGKLIASENVDIFKHTTENTSSSESSSGTTAVSSVFVASYGEGFTRSSMSGSAELVPYSQAIVASVGGARQVHAVRNCGAASVLDSRLHGFVVHVKHLHGDEVWFMGDSIVPEAAHVSRLLLHAEDL